MTADHKTDSSYVKSEPESSGVNASDAHVDRVASARKLHLLTILLDACERNK